MFSSKLIKEAHKMTKEIKSQFPEVNYKFQFGLCMVYLLKGGKTLKELTGSEKQIAWATKIRERNIKKLETEIADLTRRMNQDSPMFATLVEKLNDGLKEFAGETAPTDSKWWIENKGVVAEFIQRMKAKY